CLDTKRAKKIKAGLNAPRSLPSIPPFYGILVYYNYNFHSTVAPSLRFGGYFEKLVLERH
ncbi:hypothetical protein ABTH92_21205, partial [Acinetobacter baumannii]